MVTGNIENKQAVGLRIANAAEVWWITRGVHEVQIAPWAAKNDGQTIAILALNRDGPRSRRISFPRDPIKRFLKRREVNNHITAAPRDGHSIHQTI